VCATGDIGPLTAKPVVEGKAALYKKLAGIDVFDVELNESDTYKLVEVIAARELTFGGINLEDFKAPDCFVVEGACRKLMQISAFPDDQQGTVIVVAAAMMNSLEVVGDLLKTTAGNKISIGSILLGAAKPMHELTDSVSVRMIFNTAGRVVADGGCVVERATAIAGQPSVVADVRLVLVGDQIRTVEHAPTFKF